MATEDNRPVQGGAAIPTYIVNAEVPVSSSEGSQAATIADGADVTQGAIADAAVSTNADGTISAKLRGFIVLLVNLLSRWPSSLGTKTAANSLPVTLASNESALPANAMVFDGAAWVNLRSASITKTVTAAALGNTPLWTPAAGKKFRLMGYIIQVTAFAAGATPNLDITFQDAAVDMGIGISLSIPVAGATVGGVILNTGDVQLGNGKLSSAADNVLNINLSAALTAGLVRVTVWGTEE